MAYVIGGIFYLPVLLYAMVFQRKNRRGWRERFGGPRPARNVMRGMDALKRGRNVWVHAVSLGEINAARGIITALRERVGAGFVVVSTTTDTGYARAVELFGPERVFRFPLDFGATVRRTLYRLEPSLIVLMELEVWYNLVTMAAADGIPVCVVNGRLTERSCRRFGWIAPVARRMFGALAWVGAQDEATADRFVSVGVPRDRVTVTGSVKWDTAAIAERIAGQEALAGALGLSQDAPLWVCGSTGPGEETLLLETFARIVATHPGLQLVLVPRKPERFDEVADLIRKGGYACIRRSQHPDGASPAKASAGTPRVVLGDTMGELRKFYALADVVFVGRSLVPMGGSDPMEVAALGKPIVTGPHMENFRQPVAALSAADALVQTQASGLADVIERWLTDPSAARSAGEAGRATVRANQGATERTLARLVAMLDLDEPESGAPTPNVHSES
ncbi:MAG TPA: 3-deoxy-D-manno-octulosonic acid transferase [Phycisphaerae bacterium]|nr:3-deoxy-D-manno-octulosonic acid transferase [Phycisphaerales bacterium]HRX85441.1 3-deoxy-D-manno-octulosonic acid transferase [Phycisphaerae bacterium]